MRDESDPPSDIRPPASDIRASVLTLLAIVLIGGAMVAGYLHALIPVTLQIDGVTYSLRTHQVTVESILRDAGVVTYPEDQVIPPLTERVQAGDVIQIKRARPVRVKVDGQVITGRSLKHSVLDILADLGVRLSPHDKVIVLDGAATKSAPLPATQLSGMGGLAALASAAPMGQWSPQPLDPPVGLAQRAAHDEAFGRQANPNGVIDPPAKPPLEVIVLRAVPITLNLNGQTSTLQTTTSSVGEALHEAGVLLYEADRVQPELSAPIQAGMIVSVKSAIPVVILADGRQLRTRTHRTSVADVLADANIALIGLDYTRPPLDSPLSLNMEIQLVRVVETFDIEQEPVPYEVVWMPDPDMEIDTRDLRQHGENGVLQKRIRVRYENGQPVSRKLEDQGIVRPPKNKIITYGTRIVVNTLDTPNGPIEYWRRIRMLATSYSASTAGTPKTASYYGHTALGWTMRHGIVAVDPRVVRLGSNVYVPGYGLGAAGDTGGAIKGRRIDLGYDDDNLILWYRWVDVYLLTPAPPADSINYVIPDWPPEP